MAIEIVDLPIKNGGSFHGYVSLPEGTTQISDVRCPCLWSLPKSQLAMWTCHSNR